VEAGAAGDGLADELQAATARRAAAVRLRAAARRLLGLTGSPWAWWGNPGSVR
jgi:hypothetical protein